MALKSYTKANDYVAFNPSTYQEVDSFMIKVDESNSVVSESLTIWDVCAGLYEGLKSLVASSTTAGMIVPIVFMLLGVGFIVAQVLPEQIEIARNNNNYYDQGTTALVDLGYIETRDQYISNPGASYFRQLSDSAAANGGFFQDEQSLSYKDTFYLTIERLGMNRLPVSPNVDSGNEDIYNSVLGSTLAHFRGSTLPFSDTPGNMVIYGHSAGGSYQPQRNSPLAAFTFLSELQVGDVIKVEISGKEYKYRMQRSKIVTPEETSILLGQPGRETLTLFTCWGIGQNAGPGNRSGRMVITAVPV